MYSVISIMKWLVSCFIYCLYYIYLFKIHQCTCSETKKVLKSTVIVDRTKGNFNLLVPLVKGENTTVVVFHSTNYMHYAGLRDGKTLLYTDSIDFKQKDNKGPILSMNADKDALTVDFIEPLDPSLPPKWKFVTLGEGAQCYQFVCTTINKENYTELNYNIKLDAKEMKHYMENIKVYVNTEELWASKISGVIPNNMTFTFYYKYRPGDYRIECSYSGNEVIEKRWADIPNNNTVLFRNASMWFTGKEVTNKTLICLLSYNRDKILKRMEITMQYVSVRELLHMTLNDEKLPNTTEVDGNEKHVQYYIENQTFDVACTPKNSKDCKKYNCNMTIRYPDSNNMYCGDTKKGEIEKKIQLNANNNGSSVICSYKDDKFRSDSFIEVQFVMKSIKVDLTLKLNGKKYNQNGDIYEYKNEGEVNVECIFEKYKLRESDPTNMHLLLLNNNNISRNEKLKRSTVGLKEIYYEPMTLQKTFNLIDEDTFKCQASDADLVVRNISVTVKKMSQSPVTPATFDDQDTVKATDGKQLVKIPDSIKEPAHWMFWIAVIGAVIFIILIIVCIVKVTVKKPRDTEQLVPPEQDEINDGPPPNFPLNPSLEETYCKPADSRYTEPTYAQPYVPQSHEELYSKPVPKNQRNINKQQTHDLYASLEFNEYAKVKPKSQRKEEPGYEEVGKVYNSEPTYASVQECTRKDYANVFDNSRYVNSGKGAEYVEPSYCEVSKVKK